MPTCYDDVAVSGVGQAQQLALSGSLPTNSAARNRRTVIDPIGGGHTEIWKVTLVKYRLEILGNWMGAALLLGGVILLFREFPIAMSVTVGGAALGLLACTAWYDFEYWKRKYLLWKHAALLSDAAAIIEPHADELAARMSEVLKWDGRWDYEWGPWIEISRAFVDTTVLPALGPGQQSIVAESGSILREEIRSQASRRAFDRAQQLRLII